MRSTYLSFFNAFLSVLFVEKAGASCYYPDGSFPDDYVYQACTGDTYSSCCIPSEGDQCLSNGLCYYPGGEYVFRGACTDKTWAAPECFQHCKTGDQADSYDELVSCGGTNYCCSSDGSTCCNDDSKVFTVEKGSVVNDFSATSAGIPLATATDQPIASQTDVGAGAIPTTSSYTSKHTGIKTTHSAATTGTAAAATATSTSQPPPNKPSHVAMYAAIAAGVVILCVAVFLVWFFLRRHYKKKATTNPASYPLTSAGFERLPDKSPRPIEVPAPHSSPAPPYQPPAYQPQYQNPTVQGAMELDSPYNPPRNHNQWGKPVYEAP